ncbi:MAG: calcium-binding protein, partial [Planctomycetia bacterium]
ATTLRQISSGPGAIGEARQRLYEAFNQQWLRDKNGDSRISADDIEVWITPAGGTPAKWTGGPIAAKPDDIAFRLRLEADLASLKVPLDALDFGLPGLGLAIDGTGTVDAKAGLKLELGFGVNAQKGIYLETSRALDATKQREMEFSIDVGMPTATLTGRLGPLAVDIVDGAVVGGQRRPTRITGGFGVDLLDPGSGTDADGRLYLTELAANASSPSRFLDGSFTGSADVNLGLTLSGGSAMPAISTDLRFGWDYAGAKTAGSGSAASAADFGTLRPVTFSNIEVDVGQAISRIAGPVLDRFNDIVEPVRPILKVLTDPIPVISTLAGPTSLVTLASMIGGATAEVAEMVATIDRIDRLAQQARSMGGVKIRIDGPNGIAIDAGLVKQSTSGLAGVPGRDGGDLVAQLAADNKLPAILGALETGNPDALLAMAGFVEEVDGADAATGQPAAPAAAGEAKFAFPFITDPKSLLGLLFGKNVDLVTFDMPRYSLLDGFNFSKYYPTPVPFVFVEVAGRMQGSVELDFGYDTAGLMAYGKSKNPDDILKGFYVKDNPGAELDFSGELTVMARPPKIPSIPLPVPGASLSVDIGAGGGIYATVGFDLVDPNGDGKASFTELAAGAAQGLGGIFDVSGEVSAKLTAKAVIKASFRSFTGKKVSRSIINQNRTLVDVTLLDFNRPATPARAESQGPQPAVQTGSKLTLLTSASADRFEITRRVVNGREGVHVVRRSPGDPAGGLVATYFGIDLIEGDGGGGDDVITVDGGITARVVLEGGAGDDTLIGGAGVNVLSGGLGRDTLVGRGADDTLDGGFDNDTLWGGLGADRLSGGDGDDTIYGDRDYFLFSGYTSAQHESLDFARGGADTIFGGDNQDRVFGDGGNDWIDLGAGNDFAQGGAGHDLIVGGFGTDQLFGGVGDDELIAGSPDGTAETGVTHVLVGGAGVDTITGDAGDDRIYGDDRVERPNASPFGGDDTITGGGGNDAVWAGGGSDTVTLGAGRDLVWAGAGDDVIFTFGGDDAVFGEAGDDTID